MVFITPRRYRIIVYIILGLFLVTIICSGRSKFALGWRMSHIEKEGLPVASISAKSGLTGAKSPAHYRPQSKTMGVAEVNLRARSRARLNPHQLLDDRQAVLPIPAGANSANIAPVAFNVGLTTGARPATLQLGRVDSDHLGSVKKTSMTISHAAATAIASAASNTTPLPPSLPTATPASTPTQEIWIAIRTDGLPGSGTQDDPFDGSTAEKLDAILYSFYFTPDLWVHLMGAGPFRTDANHTWHVGPGWVISGDGMDLTTIMMVGNVAGLRDDVAVFTSDPNVVTNNATIKDITVDCNWAELALTADEGLGSRSVTDGATVQDSPLLSSVAAAFTYMDYGRTVTGGGIPDGTKIMSIQDSQHAIMSANATTTGAGISVTIGGEKNIKTGAIILWGSNNLVDHVHCINSYGSLANNREVFVIELSAPRSENGVNNVVQYCRVELQQGNHGDPFGLFGWPGPPTYLITNSRVIQCTAIGNFGGFVWSDPSIGFTSGVNFGNVSNCQIDSNTFIDCTGVAYIDTGSCDGVAITNNTLIRGQLGVGISTRALPKRKIEISGNNFLIQNRRIDGASYGVVTGYGTTTDVTICDNAITFDMSGGGLLSFWGIGAGDLNDALVCNNTVGPVDWTISNGAVGIGVILSNNHQPDGSPVPGL